MCVTPKLSGSLFLHTFLMYPVSCDSTDINNERTAAYGTHRIGSVVTLALVGVATLAVKAKGDDSKVPVQSSRNFSFFFSTWPNPQGKNNNRLLALTIII